MYIVCLALPLTKSKNYATIYIKNLKGLIIIFNRNEQSWHESNPVDDINLKRFKDEYSAKYLNKVYNPEYRLRMVTRNTPKLISRSTEFRKIRMLGDYIM